MSNLPLLDKNGTPIELGQSVRIKFCDGPYGQTQTVEGVIESIDRYQGCKLKLTSPATWRGRDHSDYRKPGDLLYVPMPHTLRDGKLVCDEVHNDFEHGHHAWVEVLAPVAAPASPAKPRAR